MSQSKLRKAIGAVKDRTSIGLAKVGSSASLAELEIAIVKATRHDEYPADEKHVREILSLTSYSRSFINETVSFIARRLNKTKNWVVALKTLMLIQRLLSEGDPAFEQEIFFATRRGTRLLNLSDFRDSSRSDSWDYSAFVRTFALYLDERLEFRMLGKRGKRSMYGIEDEDEEYNGRSSRTSRIGTPTPDLRTELIFSRLQHLHQLLERFLACRPTGAAKNNRVVIVALYPIVKESFQIYYETTDIMGILIDRFMELEIHECVKIYEMFCRSAKQFNELDKFYNWCKSCGIARSSEYPEVEKISSNKLDLMDDFITERSAMARSRRIYSLQRDGSEESVGSKEPVPEEKEDLNAVKALPPPEEVSEAKKPEVEEKKEEKKQEMGDLLNLGDDAESGEDYANKLALALFDLGGSETAPSSGTTLNWQAFGDDADWETALVQAASSLAHQQASLRGGFDSLLLDGMYQQGAELAAMKNVEASGSASSVALGSAGRPAMLALPAPPAQDGGVIASSDPFAASVAFPPPSYVQMSDLEKKQNLLVEEQFLWHQYARDGMQGQLALAKLQANPMQAIPYNLGPYPQNYSRYG